MRSRTPSRPKRNLLRTSGRSIWYASPATDAGSYELVGAGMLVLAGGGRGLPLDYDELERWHGWDSSEALRHGPGSGDATLQPRDERRAATRARAERECPQYQGYRARR